MPIELWIDDGSPWYLSPDIWIVPNDDPNETPGQPVENISAYVWTRVHNRGTTAVTGATVNYYWADPSTVITRSSAHLIGFSAVSLMPGETREVLCITPWMPQFINNGHECLLTEVFHPSDPLLPHTPSDPFQVPSDRHIAQRNISVIGVQADKRILVYPFLIANTERFHSKKMTLRVRQAPFELLKPLQKSLGLRAIPKEAIDVPFGLQPYRCGQEPYDTKERELVVALDPGKQLGFALSLPNPKLKDTEGALFLIEQLVNDEIVGGVATLFVSNAVLFDKK